MITRAVIHTCHCNLLFSIQPESHSKDVHFGILYPLPIKLAFNTLTLSVGHYEDHLACRKLSGQVLAWLYKYNECDEYILPSIVFGPKISKTSQACYC